MCKAWKILDLFILLVLDTACGYSFLAGLYSYTV